MKLLRQTAARRASKSMVFYIVSGWRDGRVAGQWVIAATDADDARLQTERRPAAWYFDAFTAEAAAPGQFEAEET